MTKRVLEVEADNMGTLVATLALLKINGFVVESWTSTQFDTITIHGEYDKCYLSENLQDAIALIAEYSGETEL